MIINQFLSLPILEDLYQGKWKNLRDTFIKSTRGTQPYKYHEILKFLLKNIDTKKQSSPVPGAQAGPSNEPCSKRKLKRPNFLNRTKLASKQKRRKLTSVQTSVKPEEDARNSAVPLPEATYIPTSSVHSTTEAHEDTESAVDGDESDKHFFISILPLIKNFSTTQQLDFRLGVLSVIKDIKTSSQMSNSSSALVTDVKQEVLVSDSDSE